MNYSFLHYINFSTETNVESSLTDVVHKEGGPSQSF